MDAVGVFIDNDNTVTYRVLRCKKTRDKLSIDSIKEIGDNVSLRDIITNPIILLIDGKGILNKKISTNNEADVNWERNLDYRSIHHLTYFGSHDKYISFCRKETADQIIDDFQSKGFDVLNFYIGPLPAILLHQQLKEDKLHSNESILEFAGTDLNELSRDIERTEKEYLINGSTVSKYHLPLYGVLVNYFVHQKEIERSSSESIGVEELVFKKAFYKLGTMMLAGFFVLLLISYFCIQYFGSKNMELQQQNVFSKQSYQQILQMEAEREQKFKILEETGLLSDKFLAFYSYELTASIPNNMRLNSLNIFPVDAELKAEKKTNIKTKEIVMKGSADNEQSFNWWMDKLRKFSWISKFEIVSFKKDKKNMSQFEIKIITQ